MFTRPKRLVLLFLALGLFVLGDFALRNMAVLPGFASLERGQALTDAIRCKNAIRRETRALSLLAREWGGWDDLYDFAATGDTRLAGKFFSPARAVEVLDVNLVYVLDTGGNTLQGRTFDPDEPGYPPLIGLTDQSLRHDHFHLAFSSLSEARAGLIMTSKGLMLVGSAPITGLTRARSGAVGVIVIGRLLDSKRLDRLKEQIQVDFSLLPVPPGALSPGGNLSDLSLNPFTLREVSPEVLSVYGVISDIEGEDASLLHIGVPRAIMARGREVAGFLSLALYLLAGTVLAGGWALMRKTVHIQRQTTDLKALAMSLERESAKRLRAAQDLRESKDKYRLLVENQRDMVAKIDPGGRFLYVSPSLGRFLGVGEAELLGACFPEYVLESDRREAVRILESVRRSPFTARVDLRGPAPDSRWVSWTMSSVMGLDGVIEEIILAGRDVTERKQAEADLVRYRAGLEQEVEQRTAELRTTVGELRREIDIRMGAESELRESEKLNATLFRISNAISATADLGEMYSDIHAALTQAINAPNLYIALINEDRDALEFAYFHDQRDESLPSIIDISHPDNKNLTLRVVRMGRPILADRTTIVKWMESGEVNVYGALPEVWLGVPLKTKDKVIGALVVQDYDQPESYTAKDVDFLVSVSEQIAVAVERKLAQEEVFEAKEMAEAAYKLMSDFVTTVSHEMRTPMTSVLGFAKMIKKDLGVVLEGLSVQSSGEAAKAGRIRDNLEIIISEGRRLTGLINDVLDLARLEARKVQWQPRPTDPADLLERAAASTAPLFKDLPVELDLGVEPDLPLISCDPERILQVLVNLFSNAAKFTTKGRVSCRVMRTGAMIEISVADTGRGIPPEDRERIFDKFTQTRSPLTDKPRGTGLGLAICREIVEQHGGRIWVEGNGSQGSVFRFTLPLAPDLI